MFYPLQYSLQYLALLWLLYIYIYIPFKTLGLLNRRVAPDLGLEERAADLRALHHVQWLVPSGPLAVAR